MGNKLKLGQAVKARFMTLPSIQEHIRKPKDEACPLRDGVVTFIHPQGRFVAVTTHTDGGDITETFRSAELL